MQARMKHKRNDFFVVVVLILKENIFCCFIICRYYTWKYIKCRLFVIFVSQLQSRTAIQQL